MCIIPGVTGFFCYISLIFFGIVSLIKISENLIPDNTSTTIGGRRIYNKIIHLSSKL